MARTKRSQQSYSAGERGRNRVRVFPDPKTGMMQIEWREHGRRLAQSLKHRDWEKAKQQADEFAVNYVQPQPESESEPEPLTLGRLFDIYGEEVTPTKAVTSRTYEHAAAKMFSEFLGRERDPRTLSLTEWDRFIEARTEGRAGMSREPVGARTVQRDLRFLLGVLNWAAVRGAGHGGTLLERNPLKGLRLPKEKNPRRVILTSEEYQSLLEVADQVDWRFKVALVLTHETGHRIGAIRQLRWSDINFEDGAIRWRASTEKTGYEHVTPMSDQARAVLRLAQKKSPGIGDAYVLPAPTRREEPMSKYLATSWWKKAELLAGLAPQRWRGWHSLRRRFASDLMDLPLKLLCTLGGWKSPQTVLECYQHPDQEAMRAALAERPRAAGDDE